MGQELKKRFMNDLHNIESSGDTPQVVVVAVKLPSGAIETITNTQELASKLEYYANAYNEEFKLSNNPAVEIVGYMIV
jgi:hypothetical protein